MVGLSNKLELSILVLKSKICELFILVGFSNMLRLSERLFVNWELTILLSEIIELSKLEGSLEIFELSELVWTESDKSFKSLRLLIKFGLVESSKVFETIEFIELLVLSVNLETSLISFVFTDGGISEFKKVLEFEESVGLLLISLVSLSLIVSNFSELYVSDGLIFILFVGRSLLFSIFSE